MLLIGTLAALALAGTYVRAEECGLSVTVNTHSAFSAGDNQANEDNTDCEWEKRNGGGLPGSFVVASSPADDNCRPSGAPNSCDDGVNGCAAYAERRAVMCFPVKVSENGIYKLSVQAAAGFDGRDASASRRFLVGIGDSRKEAFDDDDFPAEYYAALAPSSVGDFSTVDQGSLNSFPANGNNFMRFDLSGNCQDHFVCFLQWRGQQVAISEFTLTKDDDCDDTEPRDTFDVTDTLVLDDQKCNSEWERVGGNRFNPDADAHDDVQMQGMDNDRYIQLLDVDAADNEGKDNMCGTGCQDGSGGCANNEGAKICYAVTVKADGAYSLSVEASANLDSDNGGKGTSDSLYVATGTSPEDALSGDYYVLPVPGPANQFSAITEGCLNEGNTGDCVNNGAQVPLQFNLIGSCNVNYVCFIARETGTAVKSYQFTFIPDAEPAQDNGDEGDDNDDE